VTGNQTPGTGSTRDAVVDRYSGLARTALAGGAIADCDPDSFAGGCFGAAAYPDADGAPEAALRASLGCGNPVAVASLNPGETVLDLGSGGGLDVLLSARRVGPAGTVYGLDASPDMLALARANAAAAGVTNAVFLHGHIEDIPLPDEHVDVVISNCVICLSADKPRVLAEAFRVLRPGGRLGISDVIADDGTDSAQLAESEQWAGCVSVTQPQYPDLLLTAGFTTISITSTHQAGPGLHSAIIQAAKPAAQHRADHPPGQRVGGDLAAGPDGAAVGAGHGRGRDRQGGVHQRGPGP
jgi:arsenite methyltransferase